MEASPARFVLDTDIGTDVDDLLALALCIGSPDLTVGAVTTVYGDVELRARLVAHAYALAGVPTPPIIAGLAEPRSGRPVWLAGHEGRHLPPTVEVQSPHGLDPVEVLAKGPVVVAIAPLTNVAAALERPGCAIAQIVMMGGEFRDGITEHNIRCDVAAADVVFSSGTPVLAIGLDQTERLQITGDVLSRFIDGSPLGSLIDSEVRQFWAFAGHAFNVPHDPMAVMALARPDLFELRRGEIRLDTAGPEPGRTTFEPDEAGPHAVVVDFDRDAVADEIITRLSRATAGSAQHAQKETVQ